MFAAKRHEKLSFVCPPPPFGLWRAGFVSFVVKVVCCLSFRPVRKGRMWTGAWRVAPLRRRKLPMTADWQANQLAVWLILRISCETARWW